MKAYEITKNVYWVGAIDWDLRNFHGYQTEQGSTYNAYLIIDDKITLIDTVKKDFYNEMLSRISSVIDPSQIDYIVSNHVEMDHSGGLPEIINDIEDVIVYTSKQGKDGLNAHYNIENWNLKTINPDKPLNLGEKKLNFLLTPMVHWPDNMVSYLESDKILFSNDAFGQHYASYERTDKKTPLDIILKEAKKYYANIVMPYGKQVQTVLKNIKKMNLEIKKIAPSHGIIWEENIADILDNYNRWSSNQTLGKSLIVYDTMWGSTKTLAYSLYEYFESKNIITNIKNLNTNHRSNIIPNILDADYICVGSPTLNNNMLPSIAEFLTYLKGLSPGNRKSIAFGSYGWGGQSIDQVAEMLESADFEVINKFSSKFVPETKDLELIKNNIDLDNINKKKTVKERRNEMNKYKCNVCGYIYEPEKGDSKADIPAGTSFDDLPEDWECPVCGVGKDQFEKVD